MAEKRLSIRLAAIDGKVVEQTFKNIGDTGERAFQRISSATKPASADLKAVDVTARALNGVLRQAAGFVAAYAGIHGAMSAVRSIAETGIRELRDLLSAMRTARNEAFRAFVRWLTLGLLALLVAGVVTKISYFQKQLRLLIING